MLALVVLAAAVVAIGGPFSHCSTSTTLAVSTLLAAGAVWILLCFDRGLLQAHRSYRTLSVNLLVEGGVRTAAVFAFVGAGAGPTGAAAGMLVAEAATAIHARVMADRAWGVEARAEGRGGCRPGARRGGPGRAPGTDLDLVAALVALAMIALLQNIDVIVVGREAPA